MTIQDDRLRARKVVLLCVALTALTASRASGLVFCKGRKPTITVRDKCRKREQQVDAKTIGGLKGDPGAPGPAFHVVDKDGKEVGSVVAVNGTTAMVLREINGEMFELEVSSSGFGSGATELTFYLAYADPACASQAYVGTSRYPLNVLATYLQVSPDGRTGYYALPSEQRVPPPNLYAIVLKDGIDDTGARTACLGGGGQIVKDAHDCLYPTPPNAKCVWCCAGASGLDPVSPVHTIDVSSFGLTPPFTLKRQ